MADQDQHVSVSLLHKALGFKNLTYTCLIARGLHAQEKQPAIDDGWGNYSFRRVLASHELVI